jgi:Domain of unknown function (DUF4157)
MQKIVSTGNKGTKSQEPSRPSQQAGQGGRMAQLAAIANRSPQVQTQLKLAAEIESSPRVEAQRNLAGQINAGSPMAAQFAGLDKKKKPAQTMGKLDKKKPAQSKSAEGGSTAQREEAPAPSPNRTGLPDQLKSGVESLSGMSLDDVKVHYNAEKPAQLNALAYAQGTDIHVAPGQEQHLPHEAWHIVQQKQGRVQPTMQMKQGIPVNDDRGLEKEADVMGAKAASPVQAAADKRKKK